MSWPQSALGSADTGIQVCNCRGPEPGETVCPCLLRARAAARRAIEDPLVARIRELEAEADRVRETPTISDLLAINGPLCAEIDREIRRIAQNYASGRIAGVSESMNGALEYAALGIIEKICRAAGKEMVWLDPGAAAEKTNG